MAAAPAEMMGKQDRAEVLLRAAIDGNLRLLKKMAWGMDAGQGEAAVVAATADTAGRTALHLAAMEGRMDVLKYVVEDLHLDVNARCSRGRAMSRCATKLSPRPKLEHRHLQKGIAKSREGIEHKIGNLQLEFIVLCTAAPVSLSDSSRPGSHHRRPRGMTEPFRSAFTKL
uniref:Uncharacterized protein n=1 Tax=Arundo donax TaxID=35708 RepID=A0A0A9DFX4_ARUDO